MVDAGSLCLIKGIFEMPFDLAIDISSITYASVAFVLMDTCNGMSESIDADL